MTIDAFVLLAPILLLGVVALLAFVGCGLDIVGTAVVPTATLTASPSVLNKPGLSTTLSWTTTNANSATIDNGIGAVALPNGSISTENLASTTVFNIMVIGYGGTVSVAAIVNVIPPPTIFSVSPNSGSASGGTLVTISGANFQGSTVTFGGTPAAIISVTSTSITATTPPHAAGAVNVIVTNSDGQTGTLTNGYTYTAVATGPIAFVQAASGPATAGALLAAVSVPYAAPQKVGNLNVVVIGLEATPATTITVSDSQLNTYNQAATLTAGNGLRRVIFYAPGIKAGANTVKASFAPAAGTPDVRILEYSGVDTLDTAAVASASGTGAAADSGAKTTAKPNELIVGAGTSSNTFTAPGGGFTQRVLSFGNIVEDKIVTTVGSNHATATNTATNWVMQMVCFFKS
jgi:IPT/TIG domain